MENFIKQNWFKLGILVILGIIAFAFLNSSIFNNRSNVAANPEEKIRCQNEAGKWAKENTKLDSNGIDSVMQSHFNPKLNTCLVEYTYQGRSPLTGTVNHLNKVVDIYDNKVLLEMDIDSTGVHLFGENGTKINTFLKDPSSEYYKRLSILFEAPQL